MSIEIFGLTFYLYGFIVGVAVLVGYTIGRRQAMKNGVSRRNWDTYVLAAACGGVIGARLYHGFTDWYLYKDNWWELLLLWRGGLSIIGAVAGGLMGVLVAHRLIKSRQSLWIVLDSMAFGLPVAQAIGRLGNYVNQELYGLPTTLPWGIFISPEHRLKGYEHFDIFHPLFAYEAVAMLLLAASLFVFYSGKRWRQGTVFLTYVIYYSIIRFLLDFLRINNMHIHQINLNINQLIVLLICVLTILYVVIFHSKKDTYIT